MKKRLSYCYLLVPVNNNGYVSFLINILETILGVGIFAKQSLLEMGTFFMLLASIVFGSCYKDFHFIKTLKIYVYTLLFMPRFQLLFEEGSINSCSYFRSVRYCPRTNHDTSNDTSPNRHTSSSLLASQALMTISSIYNPTLASTIRIIK